jgi:hypothetical protein
LASNTSSGVQGLAGGEARQILPPMVAVLRTCSDANWCAASQSTGSFLAHERSFQSRGWSSSAPMRRLPPLSEIAG